MEPFARMLRRARYFLRHREFDREMEEELRFHIDKETEKYIRAGMTPREARRRAIIALGAMGRHVEETRQARGTMLVENALRDTALGLRRMRRRPLYVLAVCGTLALGLTAAIITATVAWKVWLSPMPYPDPEGVVRLWEIEPLDPSAPATGQSGPIAVAAEDGSASMSEDEGAATGEDPLASRRHLFSEPLSVDFHEREWQTMRAFSTVFRNVETRRVGSEGAPFQATDISLTPDGYEIFGIRPVLGRLPVEPETEVMLSERRWRETFGADPEIIGRRIGITQEIVGVASVPAGYPGDVDLLTVHPFRVQVGREFRWVEMVGRVEPGFTVAQAEAEMNAFLASLAELHSEHRGWSIEAVVLADDLIRPFRSVLALLLAAGIVFLLLATVNVLGLVAARRLETREDRAIRLALGAQEGQLLLLSLTESVVLAGVGSVAGVAGAWALADPLMAMIPQDIPRLAGIGLSLSSLVAGLAIGLGIGLVIGLLSYLLSRTWGSEVGLGSSGRSGGLPRRTIVVGQVALTTLLTAGGAAVFHRVAALRAVNTNWSRTATSKSWVSSCWQAGHFRHRMAIPRPASRS